MNEELGVPTNITGITQAIKANVMQFLTELANDDQIFKADQKEKNFTGTYTIGNYTFHNLTILFNIIPHDEPKFRDIEWAGAAFHDKASPAKWNKKNKLRLMSSPDRDTVKIQFDIVIKQHLVFNIRWKDVLMYTKQHNMRQIDENIAHEIKHAYDTYVQLNIGQKPKDRIVYDSMEYNKFYFPRMLQDFFYNSYFFTSIENLVRPTEFYQSLVSANTTKRQFIQQFRDYKVLEQAGQVENLEYIDLVRSVGDQTLKRAYNDFMAKATNRAIDFAAQTMFDKYMLTNPEMHGFLPLAIKLAYDDLMKDVKFFETKKWGKEAYPFFYKYLLSKMKKNAFKVKRKLAKIYALLPEEN
jgi:hypothetical protein